MSAKTGTILLPLHPGRAPEWLVSRMERLADLTCKVMRAEGGPDALLRKLSDPLWFQSYGCLLGFDWHSSGLTTVLTGVLNRVLTFERHGLVVLGGKGLKSREVPEKIAARGIEAGLTDARIRAILNADRLTAKVDTSAIQAGYPLYHHVIAMSEQGTWTVVQQGMNDRNKKARRTHWCSESVASFVVDPHTGIQSDGAERVVLNMTDPDYGDSRKAIVDVTRESPNRSVRSVMQIASGNTGLDAWVDGEASQKVGGLSFEMSGRLDFRVFDRLYDLKPVDFEELLSVPGVGPATVRALALLSQLTYGTELSWRDPVKYAYAVGGKDGVPYPVDRDTYDETIRFMKQMVDGSELDWAEKRACLGRMAALWERVETVVGARTV